MAEKIFQQLDNKSLAKSREVESLWLKFIDQRNYPWLRIVNIPTILQNRNTYMHLAAQCGQTNMFEMILNEEDNKNAKNRFGVIPFSIACRKGHLKIALILLKKADDLKIDLSAKCEHGSTAFYEACYNGHLQIVDMIMKSSVELNIDLNTKHIEGTTAFQRACWYGHSETVEIILKNSSNTKIDLNIKDDEGLTPFHYVCKEGRDGSKKLEDCIRIVDMMIEQSEYVNLDLKAKDNNGRTGYQLAQKYRVTDVVNLIKTKMPCLDSGDLERFNLVIVGDGACGKTSLLKLFSVR